MSDNNMARLTEQAARDVEDFRYVMDLSLIHI